MSEATRDEEIFDERGFMQLDVSRNDLQIALENHFQDSQLGQINSGKVPEYLLERSRQRRAQLTGKPLEPAVTVTDNLGSRLSGIVDMYGEPCSLLAEHVAIAARRIMTRSADYLNDPPADTELGYRCVRHVAGTKEDGEVVTYFSVPLTAWQDDGAYPTREHVIGRSVRIELASEIRSINKRRLLGRAATHMAFADAGQAYMLAVTRSHVAVPILGIRMDREQPNCSFITFEDDELPDEAVAVTKHDMSNEERQRKLTAVRKLFELYQGKDDEPLITAQRGQSWQHFSSQLPQKLPFDMHSIGALERLDQVLGVVDRPIEFIIDKLQSYWHSDNATRNIMTEVSDGGITYPALVNLTVSDMDSDTLVIGTAVTLPDAPSFGTQQVFPTLRVYPASRYPLRFDGIEPDSVAHDRLIKDFYELITQFKATDSETNS